LAVVVFGSLIGEFLDIHHLLPEGAGVFGLQGWEYLDLGRFWQILLTAGLFVWAAILFRGTRVRLARESRGNMPWLFLLAALAIPAFYAVGLLATRTRTSPTPTSGASGSCTCGSRTSSNCSRP
jgi:nitric oxide reductase subunit B